MHTVGEKSAHPLAALLKRVLYSYEVYMINFDQGLDRITGDRNCGRYPVDPKVLAAVLEDLKPGPHKKAIRFSRQESLEMLFEFKKKLEAKRKGQKMFAKLKAGSNVVLG